MTVVGKPKAQGGWGLQDSNVPIRTIAGDPICGAQIRHGIPFQSSGICYGVEEGYQGPLIRPKRPGVRVRE